MTYPMKKVVVAAILASTILSGCAVVDWLRKPETATRIAAGGACLAAFASKGIELAADQSLGFVSATQVVASIVTIGSAAIQTFLTQACQETIALAAEDATGAQAMLNTQADQPVPPDQPQARRAPKRAPAPGPVRVIVPLGR